GSAHDAPSVVDLGTGAVGRVSPSLVFLRNLASITPFGMGALVAGGVSPPGPGATAPAAFDTAEVYEPAPDGGVGGFTESPLILGQGKIGRASHGAVVLATG